jgi:hypothetical protein
MAGAVGTLEEYGKLFAGVTNQIAIGESSTTYLDSVTAPALIKEHVPDAKIIVVLRNPVERAYASFMHLRRDGAEPEADFRRALALEDQRVADKWSFLWHYKGRQYSYDKLKRFIDLFGHDKVRVYLYEDLKKDNAAVVTDVCRFLGVRDDFRVDTTMRHNVGGTPKNELFHKVLHWKGGLRSMMRRVLGARFSKLIKTKLKEANLERPEMPKGVRAELVDAFESDILRVQELIGRDLSPWLRRED